MKSYLGKLLRIFCHCRSVSQTFSPNFNGVFEKKKKMKKREFAIIEPRLMSEEKRFSFNSREREEEVKGDMKRTHFHLPATHTYTICMHCVWISVSTGKHLFSGFPKMEFLVIAAVFLVSLYSLLLILKTKNTNSRRSNCSYFMLGWRLDKGHLKIQYYDTLCSFISFSVYVNYCS